MGFLDTLNEKVEDSVVGRFFQLKERKTTFTQEWRGGSVTFLTVAYILAVNAGIVAQTGGPCIEDGKCMVGVPPQFQDDDYAGCAACVQSVQRSIICATAAACVISHFLMGVVGNLPFAICPGMGLNAFFAFTVVGYMGTGKVTYSQALAAIFIEGFIFIIISLVGIRGYLIQRIPKNIMRATAGGIGLFLAHIGLQQGEGLGLVTYNSATLVTLGGCAPQYRTYEYTIGGDKNMACGIDNGTAVFLGSNVPSDTYTCSSAGVMRSPTMWLGIMGGMLICILAAKGVRGSMMVGILMVTFISWIPTDANTARYLQKTGDTPPSDWTPAQRRWDFFKEVATVPSISETAARLDFSAFNNGNLWLALITFLYVDFLDCTGTFFSMAGFLSQFIPNFINEETRRFPRDIYAYTVDGFSIIVGSLMGTPPLTVFVESASGIRDGARTGLAACFISFYFIIALFFSPLIASIPPYATGPALIFVGAMMLANLVKIDWSNVGEAVPAFLTVAIMPLTYSISYGVVAGVCSWIFINGAVFLINFVQLKLFPATAPAAIKSEGTFRMARAMTFTLHNAPAEASVHAGDEHVAAVVPAADDVESKPDGMKV